MRRTAAAALVAALVAGAGMLPRPAVSQPAPASSSLRFNIRDFGATPGPPGAVATRRAIETILARPRPAGGKTLQVYLPSDVQDWYIDRTIVPEQGSVEFVGDGPGSALRMRTGLMDPVLALGIPRAPRGKALDPGHWVDSYGALDASAAPAKGVRWGFRTGGEARIVQYGGPLSEGPPPPDQATPAGHWADLRQFTIDFAQDTSVGAETDWTLGIKGVWSIVTDPANHTLLLWTVDGPESAPVLNSFRIAAPPPGVERTAWQVDLDARTVRAYANRVQVAVTGAFRSPAPRFTVPANDANPFCLGGVTDQGPVGITGDWTFLGLCLSDAPRYADDGVGTPQRRIDGKPNNDLNAYFAADAHTWAFLPFQDGPAAASSRQLTVRSRGWFGESSAWVLSPEHGSNWASLRDFRVRDLQVLGTRGPGLLLPYGDAIAVGAALDCTFQDCTISGGARGIGCWNWLANYVNRVRRCKLQGDDAAIYTYQGIWDCEDLQALQNGRNTFWAVQSNFDLRRAFLGEAGRPVRILYGNGSSCRVSGVNVDIEAGDGPGRCVAESILTAAQSEGVLPFELRDWSLGGLKPGIPLVRLGRFGTWGPVGRLTLAGWRFIGDDKAAVVQIDAPPLKDGPSWVGGVDVDYNFRRTPILRDVPGGNGVMRVGPSAPGPAPAPPPPPAPSP